MLGAVKEGRGALNEFVKGRPRRKHIEP